MQNEQLPGFVSFLLEPSAYVPQPAEVKLIQTHISYVFVTDDFVYKFKKPVDFGFLDFTTLAKRHHFCQQELVLNRRLCPSIYLDLVALEKRDGGFSLISPAPEESGDIVEYGIRMKRMPEEQMMANVMESGRLVPAMIDSICDVLVPFYEKAEGGPGIKEFGRPEAVGVNILENFSQTEAFIGSPFLSRYRFERIKTFSPAFLEQDELFAARIAAGRIRDCHGDLYSANICLADQVYIFDCIEFNERFRYCDVASDIAFLAMDLDYHGFTDLSARLSRALWKNQGTEPWSQCSTFTSATGPTCGPRLTALPRTPRKWTEKPRPAARRWPGNTFSSPNAMPASEPTRKTPVLYVFFGMIATGKSTLAGEWARINKLPSYNSDWVRKELAGIKPGESRRQKFEAGIYSEDFSRKTYNALHEKAEALLQQGKSVVLDASYQYADDRRDLRNLAKSLGCQVCFILCQCSEEEMKRRMAARSQDPAAVSDGRWEIYLQQKKRFEKPDELGGRELVTIDTKASLQELLQELAGKLP